MTDDLKFSQCYIGILGSIIGGRLGRGSPALSAVLRRPVAAQSANLSIALGTAATAAFLFLSNEVSAAMIYFCAGFAAMLATVATVTLAADYCPQRAEGFAFAVLMSVINLATSTADNVGAYLYSHVFNTNLQPLVVISAAFTAFAFVLVPLLRLGDKRQGEPAAAAAAGL